jgi:hypothetical protein
MVPVRTGRSLFNRCALFAILFATACSSKNAPSNSAGDAGAGGGADLPSGEVSCTTDPRVDSYVAGLKKDGRLGVLSFQLDESNPAPPAKGANTFVLQVSDASAERPDVALRVDLKMPDHGHGTSVVPKITFDADSQSFTIAPLYLFMAGVWRIDFSAYENGSDTNTLVDGASFFFCIEG